MFFNQSEDEKEEMKELLDIRRLHEKNINRRLNKLNAMAEAAKPRKMSIANSLLPEQMYINKDWESF